MTKYKSRVLFDSGFSLLALVILIDFSFPGYTTHDQIIVIQKKRQEHYNPSKNFHYSYKAIAGKNKFSIDERFAKLAKAGDKIDYCISKIYKEVNWYKLSGSPKKSYYALRVISGFVLPLIALFVIVMVWRFQWKAEIFVFVLKTLLLADLIYLQI